MRVIAMLDYFSQVLLKPIHTVILQCLKTLPNDRTFTQDPFHQWKIDGEYFYSLDLSAATDRFPIHLQSKLLGYLFNSFVLADSWKYILTQRGYVNPKGDVLCYKVGQPMGAYSS
jgi:hypothetical protein